MRRGRGDNRAVIVGGGYPRRCVQLRPVLAELDAATTEAAAGRVAACAGPPPVAMPAIRVSRPAAVAILVVQRMRITVPFGFAACAALFSRRCPRAAGSLSKPDGSHETATRRGRRAGATRLICAEMEWA